MNKASMTEWDLFWMTWMLFFCVANCAAVLLCTYFVVVHFYEDEGTEEAQQIQVNMNNSMTTISMITHGARDATAICPIYDMLTKIKTMKCDEDSTSVCGKRKIRDSRFGMTDEIVQGKWKQRRIVRVTRMTMSETKQAANTTFSRTRAASFNDVTTLLQQPRPTSPLRRAASCGDVNGAPRPVASQSSASKTARSSAASASKHAFKQDLHDSVAHFKTHVRSFVVHKIQHAIRNAIDEVLASAFSFMTYAMLLFIVRQYSAVAIGVSLDLGAFNIAL